MTIAAIATAMAAGGIGIVRMSGDKAVKIASKLFVGKSVEGMQSHTLHLGKIRHNDKIIDSVLLSVFKSPDSYTGEDVVEINCHGGVHVCRMVLDACLAQGATVAQPGEFTRRAFLSGKMNLTEAEAVADIITATTESGVVVAASHLDKKLSDEIDAVRSGLVNALGHIMAGIDYSEEGVEDIEYSDLKNRLNTACETVAHLLKSADDGRIIKDGINTAIVGAPNVGKSSLFNAICGQDRAIVTEIAGTTRDMLEIQVSVRGCKLNLSDTAGIRESDDRVEKIGVDRSKSAIKNADIVFFVTDGSRKTNEQDRQVMELVNHAATVCLINKCDMPQVENDLLKFAETIKVSAITGEGLDGLFDYIANKFSIGDLTQKVVVTNPRHRECLLTSQRLLGGAVVAMETRAPFDIIAGEIELAISALGEISGRTVNEEIIDNIFANFCVGK